ncbi:MAG: MgtC/SapB family protein [Caldilineaceae bacterium]
MIQVEGLSIPWQQIWPDLIKLLIAFLLALPIGWEREQATRLMGLRTFPIVAMASCAYVLVSISVIGDSGDARARIIQGLMSGIGFIGGGAILKEENTVRGTATAASVWMTGAVGAAVAFQRYEIAVITVVFNFLILQFFTPLKEVLSSNEPEQEEG